MKESKKLNELKDEILNETANVNMSSQEGQRVISNLKAVHDMENDLEKADIERREMELRDKRETDRIYLEAQNERAKIEADERKSKRETGAKWGLGVIAVLLTLFGIFEDEIRPSLKDTVSTAKSLIKF